MAGRRFDPPARATEAQLPATLEPELATLVDKPRPGDWLYEIKFDGYRMLVRVEGKDVRFISRNANDWTARLKPLQKAVASLHLPPGWYDGEIVMRGPGGTPDFNALQNAFDSARTAAIELFLFDAPYLAGYDMRQVPVEERRAALQAVLPESDLVHFSAEFDAPAASLVASACRMGLEGVIGKRRGSPYVHRRSDDWIKLKCIKRQEFVIGGYTQPESTRIGIGALLVGVYDDAGIFHYAGKVGTGFTGTVLAQLRRELDQIAIPKRPFAEATGHDRRATWVQPLLVCEVAYGEWTPVGHLRHASFQGMRDDKPPEAIRREEPERGRETDRELTLAVAAPAAPPAAPARKKAMVAALARPPAAAAAKHQVKVTHGDRIIDPSTGLTKLDLVRYYAEVADWALPHLKGRHIFTRRAPAGIHKPMLSQEHPEGIRGLKGTDPKLWPGHEPAIAIDTPEDLVLAAQADVVELHTWNSTAAAIKLADRMVLDLDPGEGVPWAQVQEAAQLVRAMLDELSLASWLKTSGGKGLHIDVPLVPEFTHTEVRRFAQKLVQHLARVIPDRFVAKSGAGNRVGKIFVDYLRNGQSQTTAAAFSARARPGLGVSMTIGWGELAAVTAGDHWTIQSAAAFLRGRKDPWAKYWKSRQSLRLAMSLLP